MTAALIAYATQGVNDMGRSIAFYDAVLGALGAVRESTSDAWTVYGRAGERPKIVLTPPFNRQPATFGNGQMLSLEAPDRAAVDAFHAAALVHDGADEGLPGPREGAYAAYVRDPDGNKLCAFARNQT
jgi:catechol 2,3-dioxygenase-like lactoylglutathione lyase family enzyme